MDKQNQWLRLLGSDSSLWPADDFDSLLSVINFEYGYLRTLAENGNLYGVLLQIRDVFELVMKIPCIMALIIIDQNCDETSEGYQLVMSAALEKPLSMGDWEAMAGLLTKKKYHFDLPGQLVKILKITRDLYRCDIGPENKDIVFWRNETIGHGALRFESDPLYEQEVRTILNALKQYFGESVHGLYDDLYIKTDEIRLCGNQISFDSESDAALYAGGTVYPVAEFIFSHELTCFFFNSYYLNKKKTQFSSFMGGKAVLESRAYFDTLFEKLQRMRLEGHEVSQKATLRGEEALLEYLNEPDAYIRPAGLIEKLTDQMEDLEKGIIMIQMERGTGKSAFASRMSGLHHSKPLINGAFSRIYHLSNASLRGLNDFADSLNFSFRHSYSTGDDIYSVSKDIDPFSLFDNNLAAFLNEYHELYEKEFTILVLDGIDELTSETGKILTCIPQRNLLEEGVFIILLSRFDDEETVLPSSRSVIGRAAAMADSVIRVRRTDTLNTEVMEKYIRKQISFCESPDELIKKADYRFLYLKPYVLVQDKTIFNKNSEIQFLDSYLKYLFSLYGTGGQNQIKEVLSVFTLFPGITLNEYLKYLNLPRLTYTFIGILNDLMPLLTVTRDPDGNQYELADESYRSYIQNSFADTVQETASFFDQSLSDQLSTYISAEVYFSDLYLQQIFSTMTDQAPEEELIFFGKNLVQLYRESSDDKLYYSPETYLVLLRRMAYDRFSNAGYRLVIRNTLSEELIRLLVQGIESEMKGCTFDDPLYAKVLACDPSFLVFIKDILSESAAFEDLFDLIMNRYKEIPDPERFFWILDTPVLSEKDMKTAEENGDLSKLMRYAFAAKRTNRYFDYIPVREKLDEVTVKLLEDNHCYSPEEAPAEPEGIDNDAVRKQLQEAVAELRNPETHYDITLFNEYATEQAFEVLSEIDKNDVEISKEISGFYQDYLERLSREIHPEYLYSIYVSVYRNENFRDIIRYLYPDDVPARLAEWADIMFERYHERSEKACDIPIELMRLAKKEYESEGNTAGMTASLEKIVYEYDPLVFFGWDNWKQFERDLGEHDILLLTPLAYCTPDALKLLELYHFLGKTEKENTFYRNMIISTALIEEYADHAGWDEEKRNNQFFAFLDTQKKLQLNTVGTGYSEKIYSRNLKKITDFMETADRHSNYFELNNMIRRCMEFDRKLGDIENARKHTQDMIQMLRSYAEKSDPATVQIIETEIQLVEDELKKILKDLNSQ